MTFVKNPIIYKLSNQYKNGNIMDRDGGRGEVVI